MGTVPHASFRARGSSSSSSRKPFVPFKPLLLLCFLLSAAASWAPPVHGLSVVRLGFLLPFPSDDVAVPPRLADEWVSAARVALHVLQGQYRDKFLVRDFVADTNCSFEGAAKAATDLLRDNVVAVVGPACSEAAKGANSILSPNGIPFISFAATAEEFATPTMQYRSFFRTVYSDSFQAKAIIALVRRLRRTAIHLFYTDETYGRGLSSGIQQLADSFNMSTHLIKVPFPPPSVATNKDAYLEFFHQPPFSWRNAKLITANSSSVVVFATTPIVTEQLWKAAHRLKLLKAPWIYIGSDGVTSYDPVEGGSDLEEVTSAMQGELGFTPYEGPHGEVSSEFKPFFDFWAAQDHEQYPGLLSLDLEPRLNKTRPFVPQLIDAVWALFRTFDNILYKQGNVEVTRGLVLRCLNNQPKGCVNFVGTSGYIGFEPERGDRVPVGPYGRRARYGFVNFVQYGWKSVGYWEDDGTPTGRITTDDSHSIVLPSSEDQAIRFPPDIFNAAPPSSPSSPPPAPQDESAPSNPSSIYPLASWAPSSNQKSGGGGSSNSSALSIGLGVLISLAFFASTVGLGVWFYTSRRKRYVDGAQFVRID